jgi:hypothetical protein
MQYPFSDSDNSDNFTPGEAYLRRPPANNLSFGETESRQNPNEASSGAKIKSNMELGSVNGSLDELGSLNGSIVNESGSINGFVNGSVNDLGSINGFANDFGSEASSKALGEDNSY